MARKLIPVTVIEYNGGDLVLTPAYHVPEASGAKVRDAETDEEVPTTRLDDGRFSASIPHWSGYCLADQ